MSKAGSRRTTSPRRSRRAFLRVIFILVAFPLTIGLTGCGNGVEPSAPATRIVAKEVVVDPSVVAVDQFRGFGAEWDPQFWADFNLKLGVTEDDWRLVTDRIHWLRLPFVRMMMRVSWVTNGNGSYDWDSPAMQSMYRHLDVCQRENITVFLTEWESRVQLDVPGRSTYSEPQYIEAISAYLDHLINKRGYTCIKYFTMANEPNYKKNYGWDNWKRRVGEVAGVIAARGLPVQLAGTDATQEDLWHRWAVDQIPELFQVWEVHQYVSQERMRKGEFEPFILAYWDYVRGHDPKPDGKFFMLGETGMLDGMHGANLNDYIDTYDYGVFMADLAVQATRAGTGAISAWMLEESSHPDFNWGLWKNKAGNFAFKPWFYTWGLLIRNVPAGSILYRLDTGIPDVRMLVARIWPSLNGADGPGWTFCLVNRGMVPASLVIRAPDRSRTVMNEYLYSRDQALADDNGFPVPVRSNVVILDKGMPVTVPADAVVILTTLDQ